MNAKKSLYEDVSRLFTKGLFVLKKVYVTLVAKPGAGDTFFIRHLMTWGGVFQASVMTWGGVAKPPVMSRGVGVPPTPGIA